jgi:hypothetical protein
MKKVFYLILIIAGITLLAIPSPKMPVDKKVWIRIDSLESEGLFRSALNLTEQVYVSSKQNNDPETEIRALIYKLKYAQELEEDGQVAAIGLLEKELPDDRLVQGSLKYSMLAELYYRYYSANRWTISQNPMEDKGADQPMLNWSPERFYRVILDHYELSLRKAEQLAAVKVESLSGLWIGNLADTVCKPSLYIVLISRALDFLQNSGEFSLSTLKPAIFCSPDLFSEPDRFINTIPETEASGSNPYYRALRWYGAWLGRTDKGALVSADLQRLRYVHEQSCNESRDSLYESGLGRWIGKLAKDSAIATVYEALAQYHLDRSNLFQINDPDTLKYRKERTLAAGWLNLSKEWSQTLAGKRCQNLLAYLNKPELSAQSESYQIPMLPFPVSVEYRNVPTLYYRVFSLSPLSWYTAWNDLEPADKLNRINAMTAVRFGKMSLPDDGLMNPHRANMIMEPLPAGFYLMVFSVFSVSSDVSNQAKNPEAGNLLVTVPLSVTKTTLVSRQGNSTTRDFYFRDRDNGAPLTGLTVVPWYSFYDQQSRRSILEKGKKKISGTEGFLEIADGGPSRNDASPKAYRLEIINKRDTMVTQELFYPGYYPGKVIPRTSLLLYTDRSLYKPGDEVFYRGVLIDYIGDSIAIHRTDSIVMFLQDPKYQIVSQFIDTVDSLGVFSGSIKLPYKGLTGSYILQSKYGQAMVRMEQYRRPAFSIRIEKGSDIFTPGEVIRVTGVVTALSGEPVSGAEIVAQVDLQPGYSPRRWAPYNGQKIRITTIKSVSDVNGRFTCEWASIPDGSNPFGSGSIARYTVNISATDMNGETQQEETLVDCGRETVNLSLNIPGKLFSTDTLNGTIGAICTDGRVVKVPAKLKISKLKDPLRYWMDPLLPEPDRFTVKFSEWQKKIPGLPYKNENQYFTWPVLSVIQETPYQNDSISRIAVPPTGKWQKGWYKIELIPANAMVCKSVTDYYYVEDTTPQKIEADQTLYGEVGNSVLKTGQTLELRYACNGKGFILVDLQKRGDSPATSWYPADKKTTSLSWRVGDDWQGGAVIRMIMVRSNRVYEKFLPVSIPWENSKLTISGLSNLTKVKPGDSVSIRLLVTNDKGTPARASVGITIYDASLDLISPHSWMSVSRQVFGGGPSFEAMNTSLSGYQTLCETTLNIIEVPYIEPVSLNWFGLGYYGTSRMDAPMMRMAMVASGDVKSERSEKSEKNVNSEKSMKNEKNGKPVENGEKVENGGSGESGAGVVVIRSDFRETAVFEGNILTDKEGVAEVKFKVPDAFTEWKVLVAGHDNKLAFGMVEQHFRSAKDLMLKSNFPEFMRVGDTVVLAARLGWYGKGAIETNTSLGLSNTSGKEITRFADVKSKFSPGDALPFFWTFTAQNNEPVKYVIKSTSTGPADGLSDTIKVYSDKVQLWTAQPFFFSKPGKKQLKIEGDPIEAAFEVTTTPAWQILQSLPIVNKQERDCSEYWFSRLYLACLAGNIADKYPEVAGQFLKSSVPENQKDRVAQIREWMNLQTRGRELAYVLEKLSNLQNQDGTWPWFKGMGTDLFMTQQIIAGLGEMKAMGVFDVTSTQRGNYLLTQAIQAMDNWLYRRFREVLRIDSINPQKVHLDPLVIHYLYARSFYPGLTLAPANEIAWIHFTDRIPLEWTQHSIGLQALMGIASVRLGRMASANSIYKSLRERAKTDEQWGIYWPRKGYGSSWFEWDLWMQSRMIELFAGIEDGRKDLDQLRLYLIHQKRGRDWGNGMIAAWASKSLLFYGSQSSIEPASVGMTWGKEKYSPLRIKTGGMGVTGYYRFEWKKPQEMPAARSMEVTKNEGGPAWGTLFTLNNYQIDKLAATSGPLNISREVMIRNERGSWAPILKRQQIPVGSVIRIRLNIKSDRELSYIEIRDNLGTGFVPVRFLSGYQYHSGVSYYQSREPESIVCNIAELPKGISTIEYQVVAEQAGSYSGGYATATSLYAPEFRGWSDSFRIHARR